MNLPFFIARRYLVKQKGTFSSFIIKLAIVATALSVAVMIVALAVVTGFKYIIREKLFSFMGHVQVQLFDASTANARSEPIYNNPSVLKRISELDHVKSVYPYAERSVILQAKGQMEGLLIRGVNKDYHFAAGITLNGNHIDFTDSMYAKQMILSATTANKLNVAVGDTVQINFLEPGSGNMPRIRKARICGIYHSGLEEVDKYFGLCDLRLIQRINNWTKDSINAYQINLDDEQFAAQTAKKIREEIVAAPLEAYTTSENYSFLFDWLDMQEVSSGILLAIMAIVAIINMGSILVILMVDRATMIGLFKALGMTFETTRNIFLSIAGLIAFAGVLLGNILGLGMCWLQLHFGFIKLKEDVYYMPTAPIKIVWWHIGILYIVTLVLCVICMWLPTLYIRRVQPAKVLQFK